MQQNRQLTLCIAYFYKLECMVDEQEKLACVEARLMIEQKYKMSEYDFVIMQVEALILAFFLGCNT